MQQPDPVWIYRITHINNLEVIFKAGGLVTSHSPLASPDFVKIGDPSLIDYRKNILAPDPPGGILGDYIPFYLGPRSPMLFQIATGYEGIPKVPQEEIIYLISSAEKIAETRSGYFFSDGHARSKTATFYTSLEDFFKLDWEAIYSKDWRNTDMDLRRKEKKQAEFLVKDFVPISAILNICVFNDPVQKVVQDLLNSVNLQVEVRVSPSK